MVTPSADAEVEDADLEAVDPDAVVVDVAVALDVVERTRSVGVLRADASVAVVVLPWLTAARLASVGSTGAGWT
ncbi:hypothetical protein O1K_12545 [Xanthomonas fragariae LMG 25863]|nr:hypothetical protein O1K_12545 [Xanthomonas fragariae LMG 25863]